MNWETVKIRPQQYQRVVAIAEGESIIGEFQLEYTFVRVDGVMKTKQRPVLVHDDSEHVFDDFYLWTPYPAGGSRE